MAKKMRKTAFAKRAEAEGKKRGMHPVDIAFRALARLYNELALVGESGLIGKTIEAAASPYAMDDLLDMGFIEECKPLDGATREHYGLTSRGTKFILRHWPTWYGIPGGKVFGMV